MYLVEACVGCESKRLLLLPAVIAPFIQTYVLDAAARGEPTLTSEVKLCICHDCELAFYDLRFTEDEIGRLYAGYRSDAYYRARHRVEPFYTRGINAAIGADSETITLRRNTVGDFLFSETSEQPPRSVLDFGGDAGQFIPEWEGVTKYVYEISDVTPLAGVERVADLAHLKQPVDLVILAHVLEHASDPLGMLRALAPLTQPGGWLYVEVPLDRPQPPPRHFRFLHRRWVSAVSKSRGRTIVADLVSTPLRVLFRGRWTPFTFPKLHEHLNHFSTASLAASLSSAGWEPLTSMTYVMGSGPLKVEALGMLGRLREPASVHAEGAPR